MFKKTLSYAALSTMALSAIAVTPTVTLANEADSTIPSKGLYDVDAMTYYSLSDFKQMSRSEKVSLFKKNPYMVVDDQGNTVKALELITLSNEELEKAKTSYSERTDVQWAAFGLVAKAQITSILNGKVTIEGKEYSVASDLQGLLRDSNEAVLKDAKVSFEAENNTITNLKYLEITSSGETDTKEFAGNLVLDGQNAVIDGDVIVDASYITLKNVTINGDLQSGASFENGLYTLSVDVKGKTILGSAKQGSMASFVTMATAPKVFVVFEDSSLGDLEISKSNLDLGIKGQSNVTGLMLSSNIVISALATVMIPKVTILDGADNVELNADVGEVHVDREGEVSLTGQGSITTLIATNKGAKLSLGENAKVTNLQLPEGVQPSDVIPNYDQVKENIEQVGGQPNPNPDTPIPPVIGGGGPVVDRTPPYLETVTFIIGNKSVEATLTSDNTFQVSLTGLNSTDMFTMINFQASEKITGKVSFIMGEPITISTDEAMNASLNVSEVLGSLDPQGDGVSVGTLKRYGSNGIVVQLKDVAGNKANVNVNMLTGNRYSLKYVESYS